MESSDNRRHFEKRRNGPQRGPRRFDNRGPPQRREGADERMDKRERFMRRSRETVMQALKSRDMLLSSVTKSIEDLNETINLLAERLEDWYGIYFPEFRAEDKLQYAKAALIIDREKFDSESVSKIVGQKKASELAEAGPKSLGVKLSEKDHAACLSLARMILSMDELRTQQEAYQKELANEICPNMCEVGGPEIAAKLVSHVGSLKRLAFLPASAVQVLGAEKALFKHLRNRKIPPPKHGIIFQHPKISSSPKSVRGKIARALANKLSLAAKADAFSKRSISPELRKDFEQRFSDIMKEYERMKAKKAEAPQEPVTK